LGCVLIALATQKESRNKEKTFGGEASRVVSCLFSPGERS
jgi:hypothetical protein